MTINYKILKDQITGNVIGVIQTVTGSNITKSIPATTANTDYKEYLEWAKTNTAEAAD